MKADDPTPPPLGFPVLRSREVDLQTVEQLFTGLAFETTVLGVRWKGGDAEHGSPAAPNLKAAREAFLAGTVTSVQVHYVHEGVEWWDTIQRARAGMSVVRVRK